MRRQPAVADRFYPGSPSALNQMISELMPTSPPEKVNALSLISPHAGYIYSGKLACQTISAANIPERVIIIGPNHHGLGPRIAVSTTDWGMPMGVVPIDISLAQSLVMASDLIDEDENAHRHEHSLEVQVPFLQAYQKNLKIVPIAVSHISFSDCQAVADTIADAINAAPAKPLLVASTDMSHFESRARATVKDRLALDKIIELDPEGLYKTVVKENISMCGFIPVTITLLVSKTLGATSAHLVGYTDSGETSGDTDQVVGYAGFVIS